MSVSSDEENDDLNLGVEDDDVAESGSDFEGVSDDSGDDPETGSDSESGGEPSTRDIRKSDQPPPSEWIEFNKKVISMRPLFKSAKVQFANKLSRQIKMLRTRKGTEAQVEKCRRKAERLVEEISYVNRLKQDIIAKFALLHSKEEVTKIMNDPGSAMEYRVKAKVAAMPKIAQAADDYHRTHPDWRETLIKLIQLAGSKMKKKRRKMRGKGKRTRKRRNSEEQAKKKKKPAQKIQAEDDGTGRFDESNFPEPPPGLEELVANTDSSDQEGDEDGWQPPEVTFGDSEEDNSSKEESLNLQKPIRAMKNTAKRETAPGDCKGPIQRTGDNSRMSLKNVKPAAVEATAKKPAKRKGDDLGESPRKMTKTPADNGGTGNFHKPQRPMQVDENIDSDQSDEPVKPRKGNVDPFFMTSDNKEYKTIWKVEPADSFKNKDKPPKEPVFVFKNARTYEEVKSGKTDKRPNKPVGRKDKKGKPGQSAMDPEKLHPSWQAKKKQSLAAVPFQGKKIVFDD